MLRCSRESVSLEASHPQQSLLEICAKALMKNPVKRPKEGDVVSVKLDDGRFAVGVLARVETARPRKPYGIFVYFFGPLEDPHKALAHVHELGAQGFVLRLITSALNIYSGEWQVLGTVRDWRRDQWPFPDFYVSNVFTEKYFRVRLSEHDLATNIQREPIPDKGDLEEDAAHGSGAAQQELSRKMANLPSIDKKYH